MVCMRSRIASLAHPNLPVFKEFSFPNWHDVFDAVDGVLRGEKRLHPVGRSDRDY